jgi:hypothetical protein
MKFYNVKTLVAEYSGCRDVQFCWFKTEPSGPARPYGELIANYDPVKSGGYAERAVDEFFTEDETTQLVACLDTEHGNQGTTTVKEVPLPIDNNGIGFGAIPVGGGSDRYLLNKESYYSLPFKVEGYFGLRGCALVDGSGVFGSRVLVLDTSTGAVRWQTNVERIH